MTKKRALKLIMSQGIQRNEAQRLLLIEHEKGKTNLDAVVDIRLASERTDLLFVKLSVAARKFGISLRKMADAILKMRGLILHEHSGD